MEALSILLALCGIFWIVIGIKTHTDWIERTFRQESQKIAWQQSMINKYGYTALDNTMKKLTPRRGIVFGYWINDNSHKGTEEVSAFEKSPQIFDYANFALIVSTSIGLLIIASKGFFATFNMN